MADIIEYEVNRDLDDRSPLILSGKSVRNTQSGIGNWIINIGILTNPQPAGHFF
jgi:hypothetical protein